MVEYLMYTRLNWKVWFHRVVEKICGGVSLFEDEASVNAYMDCEIVKGLSESAS
jgi:hypothetical protein